MKRIFLFLCLSLGLSPLLHAATSINDLRVEYLKNPIGIDVTAPRFSWKMESDERAVAQTAYQIKLFSDEKGENQVWTSGKVDSDKSLHIRYEGPALTASTRYFWTVDIWDKDAQKVSPDEMAFFETGLLSSGWSDARWLKSGLDKEAADNVLDIKKYSFEAKFQVKAVAAGFIFGFRDENNFFMWQINLEKESGKTYLRPHSWKNGNVDCHAEINISDKVNIATDQEYTFRLEVDGTKATTYINDIQVDERTNPRGGDYGYGLVGFRQDKASFSNTGEEIYIDNVKVTNQEGDSPEVLFEEDFSNPTNFAFSYGTVDAGRLHIIGSLGGPRSLYDPDAIRSDDFDLEMDITLLKENASIIFSAKDSRHYYMWQINTKDQSYPLLRRHIYQGGNPTTADINLSSSFTKADILNQELPLKIEVRNNVVKTYLDGKLIDSYTAGGQLTAKGAGFRVFGGKDNLDGSACFDNVKLTKYAGATPTVILNENFESGSTVFERAAIATVAGNKKLWMYSIDGELKIFDGTVSDTRLFRSEFNLTKDIRSARIYSSALGVYDLFINGQRVGTPTKDGGMIYDELKPGWTNYFKTVFYTTYDVTGLLKQGDNAIGALVTSGWWTGGVAKGEYGINPLGFIAKLLIEYTDGSTTVVVTDPTTWSSSSDSAVRLGDIYTGENYDARRESDWANIGYDASDWLKTYENKSFNGKITGFIGPNVQVRPELEQLPTSITVYKGVKDTGTDYGMVDIVDEKAGTAKLSLQKGQTAVYNMGQNLVGWLRFKVKGKAGTTVTIRFAEMLNDTGSKARTNDGPGGSLYRVILRDAKATLNYTLKGDASGEEFAPSMTFFGFQYCDVVATDDVEIEYLKGEVVGTVAEEGSSFKTSHAAVNQLYQNIVWGQRGNFLSVPTDCPQRDERLGWTGDILAFGRAATYNADLSGFFHKWMGDVRDGQRADGAYYDLAPRVWGNEVGNAAWAEAGLVIPWTTYLMYGNPGILEENYASMEKFMAQRATQIFDGYKYNGGGTTHGDWLAPGTANDSQSTKRFIAVCFYAYSAQLMEKMSLALSTSDSDSYAKKAVSYRTLYGNIKAEFQTRYVNADGSLKEELQTPYLLALKLGLFPDEKATNQGIAFLNNLIKSNGNKLGTGFVGTAIINQVLSDVGLTDTAYNLLLQRDNPSWLYSVDQGATTMWERWDGYTKEKGYRANIEMNSFNHYAYGAVSEWMYRYMAGINPDETNPGFKQILLTPHPDRRTSFPTGQERITSVDATYNSYYGKIRSAWTMDKQGNVKYEFTIPANTTASVELFVNTLWDELYDGDTPIEEAKGVISYKRGAEKAMLELGSGTYSITIKNKTGKAAVNAADCQLFPNPVSKQLNIQSADVVEAVRLFNLTGNLLYAQAGNTPIDMENYAAGIYMVEVKTAQASKNWKVIKAD